MNLAKMSEDYGLGVEEIRARWLALRVAMWKADFLKFCRETLKIRAKDGELVSLNLNEAQLILHGAAEDMLREEGWVRLMGLKGRRQGFSTYVAARGYWRAILWDRQNIYILSHEMASSNGLFDMVSLMQEKNPFPPAVGADNAKELEFTKRGSSYTVATAGQKAGGRGGAVSYFHGSEVGYWTNAPDHFASSVQAVDEVRGQWGVLWREPGLPLPFERGIGMIEGWVKAPSEIWLETTSAGPTGEFYRRYGEAMKRIGRYRAIFVPWTAQKEYEIDGDFVAEVEEPEEGILSEAEYQQLHGLSDAKMLWRREKIHELGSYGKFFQEYPIDVTEAFSVSNTDEVFINPALILRARKRKMETPDAPLILGIDCASGGGDRFAILGRRGDKAVYSRYRNKIDHDTAVAWIEAVIEELRPSRVCIDRGNIGANIISALRNKSAKLADLIRGVDFGGTSNAKKVNAKRCGPVNVRAEMYGRLRDWLPDADIPDDDDLASDLAGPHIKYRQNNDWLLESKTDMKARGIRSTDLSDALALTFAFREFFEAWAKPEEAKGFVAGRADDYAMLTHEADNDMGYSSGAGWMQ